MNVWRGRSGQMWYEVARDKTTISLIPEYHGGRGTDGMRLTQLPIRLFKALGMDFNGQASPDVEAETLSHTAVASLRRFHPELKPSRME